MNRFWKKAIMYLFISFLRLLSYTITYLLNWQLVTDLISYLLISLSSSFIQITYKTILDHIISQPFEVSL